MILFFGPPGAGKSVQGQLLAARHGWRWLSSGQLLRDLHDPVLAAHLQTGELTDDTLVNRVIADALKRSKEISHVILDGFPRRLNQAEWLTRTRAEYGRDIELVIILEVPRAELIHRLKLRGRIDDTEAVINERMQVYRKEIYPILTYLTEQGIHIAHIDGSGTVGQVHDRIEGELEAALSAENL
ncbi:MAG TPA: nucleoside monophosphate kinase [Candidatus Saccharimonadales bacterium]